MVKLFSSDNGFVVLPTSFGGDVELALIEINHELNLIAAVRMLCWHLTVKSFTFCYFRYCFGPFVK